MAENIDHVILEHLRAIRSDIADLKLRVGSWEEHVAGMRRDMGLLHSDIAVTHKRLNHHDERLGRIERRLAITS